MAIRVRCQKSPIISPDLGNGRVSLLFPRIVRGDADKTPRFAFPSKPDCALNQLSRPESLPDTESFPGEGGLAQRFCVAGVVPPDLVKVTASC